MFNKKLMILAIFFVSLLAVSAVNAVEVNETSDVLAVENDADDVGLNSSDSDLMANDESEVLGEEPGTFTDLNDEIDACSQDTLVLSRNYDGDGNSISINKAITIDGGGHTLDAKGGRVFEIASDNVRITNLNIVNAFVNGSGGAVYSSVSGTIENCNFTNNAATSGGAVYFEGQGTVTNCNFSNNTATNGGAVHFNGEGSITNCNFISNTATSGFGGAVHFNGEGSITNCNFISNTATSGFGGAVKFLSRATVENCNFINNSAKYGGAISFDVNFEVIKNCNFTNNTASNDGGAICFSFGQYCIVENCNFTSNQAGMGGAICFDMGSSGNVTNCRFINNTASNDGGAVYFDGQGNVTNCNFTENQANKAGAVYFNGGQGTVINCNFTNNTSIDECGGAVYFVDQGTVTYCNFTNNKAIGTYSSGGAVCFDGQGIVTYCNFTNNTAASSKGGAVYFAGEGNVKNCNFTNNNAVSDSGGAVYFTGEGNVENCNFVNNTAYYDGGAVDFVGQGTVTDCNFTNNSAKNGGAILFDTNGNFVTNCNFTNNTAAFYNGGAIWMYSGTVTYCNFTNNTAYYDGGAIYFYEGSGGNVTNCNFINNTATGNHCYGGAVYFKGQCTVENCNFVNNTAKYGGAICVHETGLASISSSYFTKNHADNDGGAVFSSNISSVNISHSTFIDNIAERGGAIYNCTFENCIVEGNGSQIYPDTRTVPTIEISVENIIVGESAVIEVVLPSDIQDKVTVFVDEDNKIVNLVNGTGHASFPDLGPGIHSVSVVFGGNGDYLNTSNSTHFSVSKKTPSIVINADNMNPNGFQVIRVLLPNDATGFVNSYLYKGNNIIRNDTYDVSGASFNVSDLVIGSYNLTVEYGGDGNYSGASDYALFTVSPKITINQEVIKGDDLEMFIDFGVANENMSGGNPSVKGNVRIYIDGEEYASLKVSGNKVNYITSTDDITLGNHTVTFQYVGSTFSEDIFRYGNNKAYVPIEYNLLVSAKEIVIPPKLASNDVGEVVVEMPGDSNGTLDIYLDTGEKITTIDLSKNANRTSYKETVESVIKDCIVTIEKTEDNRIIITMTFNQKKGNVGVILDYSGDEKYSSFRKVSTASISHKDPLVSAKDLSILYSSGKVYSVVVYGINGKVAGGVQVRFLINNNLIGNVMTNAKGVASIKITYAPGSYKITASALGVKATKKLTITHVLTLKTVKVKKSAKKLVLTATLKKVNGKYLKGKRITFKFNGKTYKAKTNKKGVAKVTIKKKVLKKLKKGKKITYQATYLKDTVKKTVKVKK